MPVLYCPCCGLEIDADDVRAGLERSSFVAEDAVFNGYCRDCEPGMCPTCD